MSDQFATLIFTTTLPIPQTCQLGAGRERQFRRRRANRRRTAKTQSTVESLSSSSLCLCASVMLFFRFGCCFDALSSLRLCVLGVLLLSNVRASAVPSRPRRQWQEGTALARTFDNNKTPR